MNTRTIVTIAAAIALAVGWAAPASALLALNGAACTVGVQANCVADDPDDPAAGHISNPPTTTTTTTYDSDTTATTTTTTPVTPSPSPADSDSARR